MPVLFHDKDCLIWEVTESLPDLLLRIPASVTRPAYKAESRMLEWAGVQVSLHELTGQWQEILHYPSGAPYLENEKRYLSISHTRGVVSVQLSTYPCGIDVEYLADRALKLKNRFLSEYEGFLDTTNPSVEATLLWSAKEAVYKVLTVQEGVDFKKHLHVRPFPYATKGVFLMQETKTPYQKWYEVSYQIFDSFVFTKAVSLD